MEFASRLATATLIYFDIYVPPGAYILSLAVKELKKEYDVVKILQNQIFWIPCEIVCIGPLPEWKACWRCLMPWIYAYRESSSGQSSGHCHKCCHENLADHVAQQECPSVEKVLDKKWFLFEEHILQSLPQSVAVSNRSTNTETCNGERLHTAIPCGRLWRSNG